MPCIALSPAADVFTAELVILAVNPIRNQSSSGANRVVRATEWEQICIEWPAVHPVDVVVVVFVVRPVADTSALSSFRIAATPLKGGNLLWLALRNIQYISIATGRKRGCGCGCVAECLCVAALGPVRIRTTAGTRSAPSKAWHPGKENSKIPAGARAATVD